MMTTSNTSSNEIMDLGISYLIEKLGTVDTERLFRQFYVKNPIIQNGEPDISRI